MGRRLQAGLHLGVLEFKLVLVPVMTCTGSWDIILLALVVLQLDVLGQDNYSNCKIYGHICLDGGRCAYLF